VSRNTVFRKLGPAALTACAITFGLIVLGSGPVTATGQDTPATPPAQAGYVGSDTCLTCHDTQSVHGSAHGDARIPGSPAADKGCESCHGPGQKHVEDDAKGHMLRFSQMAPRDVSDTCVTCHNRTEHALWDSSAHNARNLGCTTCHSVHSSKSGTAQLVKNNQLEVCGSCHKAQVQKQLRSSHMPVREGKMTCTSCHNPHGSTNVKLLRVGNYINESCVSCHAEKRGPFLWDHAAGRESCSSCHDPHGSNNDRMLVARQPSLCQRCHIGTRHPSTIYDGTQFANRSNRLVLRSCTNCHQQIHGSNHPSGFAFAR
jgi:DmsE family decaheme c-type cytochrome